MPKLPLTVVPVPEETAPSAASRLAHVNRVPLRDFLQDMGISRSGLLAGSQEAVERLSALSGLDAATLRRDTPRIEGSDAWFRSVRYPSSQVGGKIVRGCPECMKEHAGLRGIWSLPFVSICADHRQQLVELWVETDVLDRFDVPSKLSEVGLPARSKPRDPSPFEHWLLRRLDSESAGDRWLDQFDLYAASQFCTELGRAAIAIRRPKWKPLPREFAWQSAAIGFELCSDGDGALRTALDHLQAMVGTPADGPRKIFGKLYDLLAADPCPDELAPFRAILRRHMVETWPLSPGDELLEEPVLLSELRSVQATARLLQRTEEELLTALEVAAVPVMMGKSEAWQVFRSADAKNTLKLLNTGLPEPLFLEALSLHDRQLIQLRAAKLLMPNDAGLWDPLAAQQLVEDLLIGAEPIYVAMHGWRDLSDAAFCLQTTWLDVVARIRAGGMRVGKYLQRSGFASVLVSLGELANGDETISLNEFAASQGLRPHELITFMRHHGLPCRATTGPRGGAQLRVTGFDRQEFHKRFMSFRTLGVAARLDWATLQGRLVTNAIAPADGARRIYDRAAVAHLLH